MVSNVGWLQMCCNSVLVKIDWLLLRTQPSMKKEGQVGPKMIHYYAQLVVQLLDSSVEYGKNSVIIPELRSW